MYQKYSLREHFELSKIASITKVIITIVLQKVCKNETLYKTWKPARDQTERESKKDQKHP